MAKSDRTIVSSVEDLEKIFKPEITGGYIADRITMPRPGDGGKAVLILHSKGEDGQLGVVHIVRNEKMKTGEASFMSVAEYDHPEVEMQMGLGESLKNSIKRMCNSEGWKISDLPGKIVHITANYYTGEKAPKCSQCHGIGCAACENTGNSTVFNVRARHDLMSPTGSTKKKVADEF